MSQRIADAVTVRMIGRPFNPEEAVSGLKSYGEGLITLWYQDASSRAAVEQARHLAARWPWDAAPFGAPSVRLACLARPF